MATQSLNNETTSNNRENALFCKEKKIREMDGPYVYWNLEKRPQSSNCYSSSNWVFSYQVYNLDIDIKILM